MGWNKDWNGSSGFCSLQSSGLAGRSPIFTLLSIAVFIIAVFVVGNKKTKQKENDSDKIRTCAPEGTGFLDLRYNHSPTLSHSYVIFFTLLYKSSTQDIPGIDFSQSRCIELRQSSDTLASFDAVQLFRVHLNPQRTLKELDPT